MMIFAVFLLLFITSSLCSFIHQEIPVLSHSTPPPVNEEIGDILVPILEMDSDEEGEIFDELNLIQMSPTSSSSNNIDPNLGVILLDSDGKLFVVLKSICLVKRSNLYEMLQILKLNKILNEFYMVDLVPILFENHCYEDNNRMNLKDTVDSVTEVKMFLKRKYCFDIEGNFYRRIDQRLISMAELGNILLLQNGSSVL